MKANWKKAIGVAILLYGGSIVYGQKISNLELGVNGSLFIYQGDLTPESVGSTKTMRFGFGIFANKILSKSFSLRTNLAYGKLSGDDAKYTSPVWRQQRNFTFTAPVLEISELAVWDVLGKNNSDKAKGLSPYIFAGAGYSFLNIKRDWSRFNSEYFTTEPAVLAGLAVDTVHSLPKGLPVFPVGAGIKYALTKNISISTEAMYRHTFTDYLDGFSQSANAGKKDNYYSYSVGLLYKFGKMNNLDCPVIQY